MHACCGRSGEGGARREQRWVRVQRGEDGTDRAARGVGKRGGEGGAEGVRGGRGAPWRRLPNTRRVAAAEAVSGKSGGVEEQHCQRAAAADKRLSRVVVAGESHTMKEERCLSPCKQ